MATTSLEVLFTPAEYSVAHDWEQSVSVVFDILRSSSVIVTALANGATEIIPVADHAEAYALKKAQPDVLLAGELKGKIVGFHDGQVMDFDLGNSPREFKSEKVQGRRIVLLSWNCTRALRACATSATTVIASFLNLRSITRWLEQTHPQNLLLVCSGTYDEASLEDTLAAGALCEKIWPLYSSGYIADSAEICRRLYPLMQKDLAGAMRFSNSGRPLLENPNFKNDILYCMQRESAQVVPVLQPDGSIRSLAY